MASLDKICTNTHFT